MTGGSRRKSCVNRLPCTATRSEVLCTLTSGFKSQIFGLVEQRQARIDNYTLWRLRAVLQKRSKSRSRTHSGFEIVVLRWWREGR